MYDTIEVNDASVEKLEVVRCEQHTSYEGMLELPFEPKEMYRTIQAGGRKKAPGNDGLGCEIYSHNWAIIKDNLCEVINQMFWAGNIAPTKSNCDSLPAESARNQTPEDYRPITLLNSDYKLLFRIIAQRLRPVLVDHLMQTKLCGVTGNSIVDALATVRNTIPTWNAEGSR
jgi:hypothetical protein